MPHIVDILDRIFLVLGMVLGFLIAPQFVIKLVAAEFSQLSVGGIAYAIIVWGLIVVTCGFASSRVGAKLKSLITTWNDPGTEDDND